MVLAVTKPKTKTVTKNGRKVTMKKVAPHGRNNNLTWQITKNEPI
jgi:hypothetical protein